MKTIEFPSGIQIGEESATKVDIAPLLFARFVGMSRSVAQAMTPKQKYQVLMQRARLAEQCTFITAAGKKFKVAQEQVPALDIAAGRKLIKELAFDEGVPGEILSDKDADGVSVAIHYKLGTPITAQGGKGFAEIEFLAKTLGDLEEILAEDANLYQTMEMLNTLATPVGSSLQSLPSWAIDQITVADGIFIMNNILPRFLE